MKDKIQQILNEIANIKIDKINIISNEIPLEVQLEYFTMSQKVKNENINHEKAITESENLFKKDVPISEKKRILVELASIPKPEVYRIIENFYNSCDNDIKNWAKLALLESRILLESELLNERQIIISTGLGGVDNKLRYFIVLLHLTNIEDSLKKIIEIEIKTGVENFNGIVEEINISEHYTTCTFLLDINEDIKNVVNSIITEINKYKEIIDKKYIITNIKKLSNDEINFFLRNSLQK